jgi:hypothetical protein
MTLWLMTNRTCRAYEPPVASASFGRSPKFTVAALGQVEFDYIAGTFWDREAHFATTNLKANIREIGVAISSVWLTFFWLSAICVETCV